VGPAPAGLLHALVQLVTGRGATRDARRIVVTRAFRGFADGLVSVLLAGHLTRLGFSSVEVGAIVTGTLLGSATLTIGLGLVAHRLALRRVLLGASLVMVATGIAFAGCSTFWPLLVAAVLGTLNPSTGDVSVFLPVEQAVLADTTEGHERTRLFAWYNTAGNLAGALGSLASGLPAVVAHLTGLDVALAERSGFVAYALIGVVLAAIYLQLAPPAVQPHAGAAGAPLARSRRLVIRLAMLFGLDSFGGGFAVQTLLVLWLYKRFSLSMELMASVFFVAGLASALSQLASPRLARRIGLVRTMVYTHLPANGFLIAAGIAPTAPLAVTCLLLRASLSQMDVPARQAYVMAVVPPEERAAAASVTNVPRSLMTAIPPLFTGLMLERSAFGWPLVCGGVLKIAYDLLLLAGFRKHAAV
jgi:MFS family permease